MKEGTRKSNLVKRLVSKLKDAGKEIGEEAAKDLVEIFFETAREEIIESENKYDDMLLGVLPMIEKQLLAEAEDINPDDNAQS